MNKSLFIQFGFLVLLLRTTEATIEASINSNDMINGSISNESTICYDELGCINNFYFADPLLWPIDLLPESRTKINTYFTLYTRDMLPNIPPSPLIRISGQDPKGMSKATFKATRPTKLYIHGWRATGYEGRVLTLIKRLLANGDFNVIVVHWGGGSSVEYNQAHANIRLVGLEIAFLVNTMVAKLGAKASDIHLIGHSLGAHTAGYAGEKIPNLGQITGLDPAGPFFRTVPTYARLDPSDAQFVEVIHTDGGILGAGLLEPLGHLDFYANGGMRQPGCEPSNWDSILSDPLAIPSDVIACDHTRAVHIYSESLLSSSCKTIGYECSDYDSFNKGKCTTCGSDNTHCAPFGLQATSFPTRSRTNVKLYFNTGESFPYCRSHYAVSVDLAKPSDAKLTVNGNLGLTVSGANGALPFVQLAIQNLQQGLIHQFLFIVPPTANAIAVNTINAYWTYVVADLLDCVLGLCNKKLYVNSITISALNSYPESNRIANTFKNCPLFGPGVISSGFTLDFSVNYKCP
ncbi:pancreatic lipase-related protein 2-like [Daphnia pulex]|uniref:pancreatic lipase-related protein 2-like n=1 Tax=Daphnia pulex TaxID=6669 RepID=UPI001EDF0943|nr:pancreatic lipase-related protein 2-like [Daphnia pulex]